MIRASTTRSVYAFTANRPVRLPSVRKVDPARFTQHIKLGKITEEECVSSVHLQDKNKQHFFRKRITSLKV